MPLIIDVLHLLDTTILNKANRDADGLSRRPQEEIGMSQCCSCHASTMEVESCPYLENIVVNCNSHVANLQEFFT